MPHQELEGHSQRDLPRRLISKASDCAGCAILQGIYFMGWVGGMNKSEQFNILEISNMFKNIHERLFEL